MGKSARSPEIVLACEVCKSRNYRTRKSSGKMGGRLELKKYCSRCRGHQRHLESR